jgi:hypothetical protein
VDAAALVDGGLTSVDDLGWNPETARQWQDDDRLPQVQFAGCLLTAPGGYPSACGWAPSDAIVAVGSPADAGAAVDGQLAAGAGFIKVALNSDAGPVLDTHTLGAIVSRAHARGVGVIAHVQGDGQAERAFSADVDRLAHAPWSERLGDALLAAMTRCQTWVSTLDIHGWGEYGAAFEIAQDNIRRFHAQGGVVRYGTDLGNGPLPQGVNARELIALQAAGLGADALVAAVAAPEFGMRITLLPESGDQLAAEPATVLARARTLDSATIGKELK